MRTVRRHSDKGGAGDNVTKTKGTHSSDSTLMRGSRSVDVCLSATSVLRSLIDNLDSAVQRDSGFTGSFNEKPSWLDKERTPSARDKVEEGLNMSCAQEGGNSTSPHISWTPAQSDRTSLSSELRPDKS